VPRLVGKKSNTSSSILMVLIFLGIIGGLVYSVQFIDLGEWERGIKNLFSPNSSQNERLVPEDNG
jgi:hypothetical protein